MSGLQRMLCLLSISLALITLTACQTSSRGTTSPTVEPSVAVTMTPSSTPTTVPSATVIPTSTITVTPYPPTPELQTPPDWCAAPIARDLLSSGDAECQLPCWYGLRVGESNVEEIQSAIRFAVGASDTYVLNMGQSASGPDLDIVTFDWVSGVDNFSIGTRFNRHSDILTEIHLGTSFPSCAQPTMPQRVLRELGEPSAVWVIFQITERTDLASLDITFVYSSEAEQSILMHWLTNIPVHWATTTPVPLQHSRSATWCLNGAPLQIEHGMNFTISSGIDPDYIDTWKKFYAPLEVVFQLTPKELYERAIQENNPCLTLEF